MNKLLQTLILFFFSTFSWAQGTIVYSPTTPDADQPLTITFTATSGSALYGCTGDVYLYSAVIDGDSWLGCPPSWTATGSTYKMAKSAANTWTITLSPTIRQWYTQNFSLPEGTPITKLGLIFHSGDKKGFSANQFVAVKDNSGIGSITPNAVTFATRPSGTVEGINVENQTTVTFVLPDKGRDGSRHDYAYIVGDMNSWTLSNDYQMKYDQTNGCWWITLAGLDAQKTYRFQYYVGTPEAWIKINDPYSTHVLEGAMVNIPKSINTSVPSYPSAGRGYVSYFSTAPQTFNWGVDNFRITNKGNLVIYELLLRDFARQAGNAWGDVKSATEKIAYLKSLGVNAVELMPTLEFSNNESWGYNPSASCFAMDPAYGTDADYKAFIDECHRQGIAVILDVVYNHTDNHPFVKLFYDSSTGKSSVNNPWMNAVDPSQYGYFNDFDHSSSLTRAYVKRSLQYLLREFRFDGFRFDFTKGFTTNKGKDESYDADRVAYLKEYHAAIKAVNPDAVMICEHFLNSEETELIADGMLSWRNNSGVFCNTAMGNSGNAFSYDASKTFGLVSFPESHDTYRMGYKQLSCSFKNDLSARMGQLGAVAPFSLLMPGPKMIWMFAELGAEDNGGEGNTSSQAPRWGNLDIEQRASLLQHYRNLLTLRSAYPEFFASDAKVTLGGGGALERSLQLTSADGHRTIYVYANLGNTAINGFYAPHAATWVNYETGETLPYSSGKISVNLPAHSFIVTSDFGADATGIVDQVVMTDDVVLVPADGGLYVISDKVRVLSAHSLDGRLVSSQVVTPGNNFVALPQSGVYVVGDRKVVVR